jgi:oxygen-dependent protoporphyrinogen oxidase
LFSAAAKLALLREPFLRPSPADAEETIAAFVRRRLGSEFLDYAIDPFVAGIYAGDPEQISVRAAFPKLHALEQRWGSLIRGDPRCARTPPPEETAKNTAKSSFAAACTLTDALAAAIARSRADARDAPERADGVFTLHAEQHGQPIAWRPRVVLAAAADRVAALVREHAMTRTPSIRSPCRSRRWHRPMRRRASRTRSTASAAWCRARSNAASSACCSRARCSTAVRRPAPRC